jgi:hypothetical protein
MDQVYQALKVFQRADDEWSEQLQAVYGKWAGDARYRDSLNGATPLLRRLKSERMAAMKEWERLKSQPVETKEVSA